METVIGMVVLLGGLIFFHEFGHYSVAKFFGVRVEVFSLGFGKKILKKTWGETEYCLSIFPLGGYVKLMGDDPYKEVPVDQAHRAFSTQALYKRFLIVAAGPLANLLLAYVLYTVVFWFGQPMPGTRVGTVVVDTPAWSAGLRPQDRIVSVSGKPVRNWPELEESLKTRSGEVAELEVERKDSKLLIPVPISEVKQKNEYGEEVPVGGIKGIGLNPLSSMIGVSNPDSIAYKAGLRTGDTITKIGTNTIETFQDIDGTLREVWTSEQPITFTVERSPLGDEKAEAEEKSFTLTLPKIENELVSPFGNQALLGIYPSDVFIKAIQKDSPAEKSGLQPGDRVAKLGDSTIYNFDAIVELVQKHGEDGAPVSLSIEREGQKLSMNIDPISTTREDPLTRQEVKQFMIGFRPFIKYYQPEMTSLQIREPFALVSKAVSETNLMAERMLISIGKLIVGDISVKNLGGPVLIASVAGKSLNAGIIPFLQMMALISINLFLLNLFPIPILDGGHLLFFTIEAVQRKPVSIRTMEIANQVGMVFILFLVGLTLYNDISRMVMN